MDVVITPVRPCCFQRAVRRLCYTLLKEGLQNMGWTRPCDEIIADVINISSENLR